jgi:D-alanine-D-alanine ligase
VEKLRVTILYDAVEDAAKAEDAASGEAPAPLVSEQIEAVLRERGHAVRRLAATGTALDLARQIQQDDADVIFNVCESFHGVNDKEQNVAALLELAGKTFTGSGSLGLALAQDKGLTKKLLAFHGIATPRFAIIEDGAVDHVDEIDFPMFVKPANADASIGIDNRSVVRNVKELMERISYVETEFDAPALIEEFIDGREIFVAVLDGHKPEALPVVEWDLSKVPAGAPRIAGAEVKWDRSNPANRTPLTAPEDLPEPVRDALRSAAVEAFRALKLRDYGRVDVRLRKRRGAPDDDPLQGWEFFLIEVNPNPHLARDAEVPAAAARAGLDYGGLIERILQSALARRRLGTAAAPCEPEPSAEAEAARAAE